MSALKILLAAPLKIGVVTFALFEIIACLALLVGGVFLKPFLASGTVKKVARHGRSAAKTATRALGSLFYVDIARVQAPQLNGRPLVTRIRELGTQVLSACAAHHPLALKALGIVGLPALTLASYRHFETIKPAPPLLQHPLYAKIDGLVRFFVLCVLMGVTCCTAISYHDKINLRMIGATMSPL